MAKVYHFPWCIFLLTDGYMLANKSFADFISVTLKADVSVTINFTHLITLVVFNSRLLLGVLPPAGLVTVHGNLIIDALVWAFEVITMPPPIN